MDKLPETYNLPRLNQNEIDSMNRLITSTEIELVLKKKKKLQAHKSPGPDSFTREFYQTYKEELTPILLKIFQKIEE